jgi:hypothetical protein
MRRKPYTEIGIRRVPCVRCGAPSVHQWNACALAGQFFGVCTACDIALNKLVLEFMRMPDAEQRLAEYAERLVA